MSYWLSVTTTLSVLFLLRNSSLKPIYSKRHVLPINFFVLQSAGWHYLGYEKMAPDDIAERHPELIGWVEQNWSDGKYFSGIHYKFFQQLCKTNVAEAWEAFDGPVFSIWGDGDIVTSAEDHEFLASIANRKQQGKGEFKKLLGVEHNLRQVPSGEPAAEMLVGVVDEWAKRNLKAKDVK